MPHTDTMSDSDTNRAAADAHDDGHRSAHGQAAESEPLGPVDVTAWAYSLAGGAVGAVVAVALLVARGG